jgi:N-glycosylase/DNA lyase
MTLSNLSLQNTLPVGQSFLWHRRPLAGSQPSEPTEEYSRAIHDPPRVVLLRQSPSQLYYTAVYPQEGDALRDRQEGITGAWLNDYFQLSRYPDLSKLYEEWRERDPKLFGKVELSSGKAVGVRVLRQDPWECLIAWVYGHDAS